MYRLCRWRRWLVPSCLPCFPFRVCPSRRHDTVSIVDWESSTVLPTVRHQSFHIELNDSGAWKIVHDVRARSCARCTLYCSRHKVVGEVSEIRRVLTTPQRDTVTHTVILPTIQLASRAECAVKSSTVLYCTYLLKRFYNMSWLVPF